MPDRNFYGWKLLSVLWGVVFVNLAFPMYGSSVINTAMMSDLNLDRRTLGFIFSLYTIMSGLPGPLVAISVDRFGIRFTLILGSLLVALGSFLMATVVNTGLHAALAFGIIVGAGVATGGLIAAQAGLARWFIHRRALALAIVYTASGVGGFLAAPLLNRIMASADGNWRMGWWFIAALSCVAGLTALAFVKERPEDLNQLPDGGLVHASEHAVSGPRGRRGAVHRTTEVWSYREALCGPGFWLLMFCQMGMSCGYTVYLAHGIVHLQDLGHTRDAGSWAISLIALSGLLSKGIIGALGDRIDPRYLWAVFVGTFGLGQFLAVQAATPLMMVAVSVCLGIGFGGGVVCIAAVLSNYYGIKVFAALAGLAVAINTTLSSVTPSIAGWLYDGGHGYQGVFYTLGFWCVAGALILFAMKPPAKNTGRPAQI
jgi:MFS family permease